MLGELRVESINTSVVQELLSLVNDSLIRGTTFK